MFFIVVVDSPRYGLLPVRKQLLWYIENARKHRGNAPSGLLVSYLDQNDLGQVTTCHSRVRSWPDLDCLDPNKGTSN